MTTFEKSVVAFSAVGAIVTGKLFFFSSAANTVTPTANLGLGFVKPLGPDVRVRGQSDEKWSQLKRESNVFKKDKIYTGSSSTAKVELKSRGRFTLEPNSLVVISDDIETASFDLGKGSFLAQLKHGAKFIVKANNVFREIKSNEATVRIETKSNGDLALTVLKGAVEVENQGVAKTITENQLATFHAEAIVVQTFNVHLNAPAPGALIWDQKIQTRFQWTGSPGRVQVSKDPLFRQDVQTFASAENSISVLLKTNAIYFWRVVPDQATTSNGQSPVSSFAIYSLSPPELDPVPSVAPTLNWQGRLKDPVHFSWRDPSFSEEYEFQMSDAADFKKLTATHPTTSTVLELQSVAPTVHFWRVVSKHPGRADLISSTAKLDLSPLSTKTPHTDLTLRAPAAEVAEPVVAATQEPPTPEPPAAKVVAAKVMAAKVNVVNSPPPAPPKPQPVAVAPPPPPMPVLQPAAPDQARMAVWAGVGANYLSFQQSGGGDLVSGSFAKVTAPTISVGASLALAPSQILQFEYRDRPGQITASAESGLDHKDYHWRSALLELQQRILERDSTSYYLVAGLQNHQVPFLSANPLGGVNLLESELNTASVGGMILFKAPDDYEYEAALRYQSLLSSKSLNSYLFSAKSNLMFDGSLGLSKKFQNGARVGLFWLGQSYNLNYNFTRSGDQSSGQQNFFNTNLEIRIGSDFY